MDDAQYDKRFTNRNRIITAKEPIWISVPINKEQKFAANSEVEINNEMPWASLHWKKLQISYNNSRYFHNYKEYFEQLYSKHWDKLFDLDFETLKQVISWLGIKVEIIRESELGVESSSTQRLVDVCKKVGADTYVAGSGSRNYMDESMFERNNITVEYQNYILVQYPQHLSRTFVPNLSIIDILANLGPDALQVISGKSAFDNRPKRVLIVA